MGWIGMGHVGQRRNCAPHAGLPCCCVPMLGETGGCGLDSTASPSPREGTIAGRRTNCAEGGRLRRNIDIGKGKIRVMSETNWTANWARRTRITDGPAGYVIAGMRRDPRTPATVWQRAGCYKVNVGARLPNGKSRYC